MFLMKWLVKCFSTLLLVQTNLPVIYIYFGHWKSGWESKSLNMTSRSSRILVISCGSFEGLLCSWVCEARTALEKCIELEGNYMKK
jgi:hypothetical protein